MAAGQGRGGASFLPRQKRWKHSCSPPVPASLTGKEAPSPHSPLTHSLRAAKPKGFLLFDIHDTLFSCVFHSARQHSTLQDFMVLNLRYTHTFSTFLFFLFFLLSRVLGEWYHWGVEIKMYCFEEVLVMGKWRKYVTYNKTIKKRIIKWKQTNSGKVYGGEVWLVKKKKDVGLPFWSCVRRLNLFQSGCLK